MYIPAPYRLTVVCNIGVYFYGTISVFFFFFGGGGHNISCPCPKSRICLGNEFLSHAHTWGGVVSGGGEYYSMTFEVIGYRKPRRGRAWEGVSLPQWGLFWIFGY